MEEFEILQIDKLNACRCIMLNEVVYSMTLDNGNIICDNDACLKSVVTYISTELVEQERNSELGLFAWIFFEEFRIMKREKVFYVSEKDMKEVILVTKFMLDDCFKKADDIKPEEKSWNIDKIRKYLIENYKEYGSEFLDRMPENFHDKKNVEKHLFFCKIAKIIFQFCVSKIIEKYEKRKDEKILMRIMCEMKIEDRKEWHLFSDEVLEAIEKLLEKEKRLESMKDQIQKWRDKWKNGETFATVTIPLFETILNVVGISKSKFTLVPDYHFYKNLVELPLKMSYNAMNVISPNGQKAYHQIQAQFLIFQYGACDINWNMDNKKLKNRTKAKIIEEMNEVGKGYTSEDEVYKKLERVKNSKLAQKTPLASFHGVPYDLQLRKKDLFEIRRFSRGKMTENDNVDRVPIWMSRYLEMLIVINMFFTEIKDQKLMKNIMRAWTVCLPNVGIQRMEDLDNWINDPSSLKQFYEWESILSTSAQYKLNNQCDLFHTEDELLEGHYLFSRTDPLRTSIANRKKNTDFSSNDYSEEMMSVWPEVSIQMSDESFETIVSFFMKFYEHIEKKYDQNQAKGYLLSINYFKGHYLEKFKKFVDVASVNGDYVVKKKKVVKIEEPVKEEIEKIMTRYVNDVKNVENCEKCRDNTQETTEFLRKIENCEKKKKKSLEIIRQNEEDSANLKSLINSDKLKYREEIQKHKEDVKSREIKIEQLNQDIKEYREESRIEREKLYENARKNSKMANENVKKMAIELESFKISDESNNKKIDELMAENETLRTKVDACEEKYSVSTEALQKAQNRVRILEKYLAQMKPQES